jgi:eukaryotic-like serine/threonine-protein kinase
MSLVGRRIGNYEIKAKIGEGGMGTVYLGEHPLIGKRVAIKVLLEELVAKEEVVSRFFNEAKAVNNIGHLNIVDIVDFGKAPGEHGQEIVYFIMEFLDGEALSSRIRRAGLPFKDTMHIIRQCCSALAASHGKGIVHRDLKPENIFLVGRGEDKNFVKILDFGIAKLTGEGSTVSHKTRTGLVIGTPTYMSPEQCEGKGLIDHRSDVYSLGIVMYELLTGCVPFPGEGFGEVLVAHLTKQPARPSTVNANLPTAIESIVMHAIEKDRNRRFQTMNEFLQAVADPEAHLRSWGQLPEYDEGRTVVAPPNRTMPLPEPGAPASRDAANPRPTTLEGAAAEVTLPPMRRPGMGGGNRLGLIGGVAAALALVGVGGWLIFSPAKHDDKQQQQAQDTDKPDPTEKKTAAVAKPTPEPEQAAPKAVPPVDDNVNVTVTSEPPGARVYRADKSEAENEPTPYTFKLKKGSPPFDIQLRLDGYQPMTRQITADESVKLVVTLPKIQAATPPPKRETAAQPKPERHDRGPSKPASPHGKKKKDSGPADDDMTIIQPNF